MTQTVDSKKDDTFVATLILGVVIALVLMGYGLTKLGVFGSKKTSAAEEGLGWTDEDASAFVPPPERQEFIDAKKGIDVKNPEAANNLKKALMKRAFKQIPLVHELQQQGPSADKLYKKGMITDALHDRYKNMKGYFDREFPEVQAEAEALAPGWGGQIWMQANQLFLNIRRQEMEAQMQSGVSAAEDESIIASITKNAPQPMGPPRPPSAQASSPAAVSSANNGKKTGA